MKSYFIILILLFITVTTSSASFSDNFITDTTSQYSTEDTWTAGGIGSFTYDSGGERTDVQTGDDVALTFSRALNGASTEGSFSIDFLPTVYYPNGGIFTLKLMQDANSYYQIENTDNYGSREISKYVNGVKVDSALFTNEYTQGVNYTVSIAFSPNVTTVEAFGETLTMNSDNTAITVNSFSVETLQQDAFYDNIVYSIAAAGGNIPPTANAGADQSVEVNQTITITGSGSDSDGNITSYEWKKDTTVLATTASFDYTPDTVGIDTLTLTVTDNNGSIGSDSMAVTVTAVPSANTSFNDDFITDTTSQYSTEDTWTAGGIGSFTYDSGGERTDVQTGDDVALTFSRALNGASTEGSFSIDFLPTVYYPNGGIFTLKLMQDANSYYQIENTDNYGSREISKYVNGVKVDSALFTNEYTQGVNYTVSIAFSPNVTTVEAFGETLTMNSDNTAITVNSFSVETLQQDAFYDNIVYSIAAAGGNIPPIANAGADQSVEVNQTITITGSGSDSDGNITSYEWKKDTTVLATTASFDYTPDTVGIDTLTLTVTDNNGSIGSDSMTVTVTAVNIPPTANAGADQSVEVNQTITITGSGSDSDGNITSYEWKKDTTVLATTASLDYTPDTVGIDTLTLTVTDNSGSIGSDSMTVTVTAVNIPPTANAGADQSVEVNQTITITGSGSDSDGNITSYEWRKDTTVLATTASLDYTPDTVGIDTLTLTVTDNSGSIGSDSMTVTVSSVPVLLANAGADQSVEVNQTITITGSGSDSDGNITSYEWRKDTTVLATTASFDYTPDTVGIDTLTLTVTDNNGSIGSDSMDVTVTAVPVLKPWNQNPWYWSYRDTPILLLGGSDDDNLFQWSEGTLLVQLEELVNAGGNVIRNTMSDRKGAEDFEVYPFYQQEDEKYDLNQWNNEYWDRFERLLRETAERGIIVQIEIWDRFDYSQSSWDTHPYNPINNVNYTSEQSGFSDVYPNHPSTNEQPFFFTTPNQQNNILVLQYQKRFVNKMLDYALQYDHIIYCMDNETSGEEEWSRYWAEYIQSYAGENGQQVFVTEMWDDWNITSSMHKRTFDHPELYNFVEVSQNNQNFGQEHWDNFIYVKEYLAETPRPINTTKTYGADGYIFGSDQDGIERFWRHLLAGAASMRFHRPSAGLGLNDKAVNSIRAARKLESIIPLWLIDPSNELLSNRIENEAYLAVDANYQSYVLYFPAGGEVEVDVSDVNVSDVNVSLVAHWIDVDSGEWGPTQNFDIEDRITVVAPGQGNWAAAIMASTEPPSTSVPVANAGANQQVIENDIVTLDGSDSNDPDGTITAYEWKEGGTVLSTAVNFEKSDFSVGLHTIILIVTDNEGAMAMDSMTVTVTAANIPPTANAGADQSVEVNQTITITGSGSDSDGNITSYEWKKDTTVLATTASFDYTPDTVGIDTLTLTVTDNNGSIGSDSMTVTVTAVPSANTSFNDDFITDTTSQYSTEDTWTAGGIGSFTYDSGGERTDVQTGDDVALTFSRALNGASTEGSFSIDFLPTVYYPNGGIFTLKLMQDANSYYQIENTDNYGSREISKYVNGVKVDSALFTNEYTQGVNYTVSIAFSPNVTTVEAFGETLTMNSDNTAITVNSFSVETLQQDAFYDNIVYSIAAAGGNIPPIANAGADQSVEVNQTITITGSGSDSDGNITSYEWKKDTTVLATTASFDYTPDTVGIDTLTLTVTDNNGSIGSDSMTVTVTAVPSANTSFNDDFITDTTSQYSTEDTWTAGGIGSFTYDSGGERTEVRQEMMSL